MDLSSRFLSPTTLRLLLIWAILFLPAGLALGLMPHQTPRAWLKLMAATFCLSLGLWLLRGLPRPFNVIVLGGVITTLLTIRIVQLGLVNFSGTDFSTEFFLHLDLHTLVASWHLYGWRIPLGIIGALAMIALCLHLSLRLPKLKASHSLASGLVLIAGLLWSMHSLPESRLYQASIAQLQQLQNLPELHELQKRWRNSALVNPTVTPKSMLRATAPPQPKNLILVYLESVGLSMLDNPQWPDLMPNLKALHQQHSVVPHFHASGFITIEGIVNSQCGTLFPFHTGSDSLANGANLAENMACLGDILQHAGYENHYLGGAPLSFSGKGAFLTAHGYPTPHGIKHWRSLGLETRSGKWGLSDPELFMQATQLISKLHKSESPFNLTLLTIGTHLPGFIYKECKPYPHSEDSFLNSLHCTDQLLQQWLQQLSEENLLQNTIVAITADHQVFSNHNMRKFFGDAVFDRRLPFIVLDPVNLPSTARDTGAGYDLAPTILDLLNINHNIQFPLGRSLLRHTNHPLYFVNRYEDVVDRNITRRGMEACETEHSAPDTWSKIMTKCQKNDLFNLLRRQIEWLSETRTYIDCNNPAPLATSLSQEGHLSFKINQNEIINQFTAFGKPISKDEPGLYLVWFDHMGKLLNLQFAPARTASNRVRELPYKNSAHTWLALWAPDKESNLPDWLPGDDDLPGIFWGEKKNDNIYWQTIDATAKTALEWALPQQNCYDIYH